MLGAGGPVGKGFWVLESSPLGGLDFPVWWLADDLSLDEVKDLPLGVVTVFLVDSDGGGCCVELQAEAGPYVFLRTALFVILVPSLYSIHYGSHIFHSWNVG